jgi:16S rRNA (guanine966-N2)-methyltransferase
MPRIISGRARGLRLVSPQGRTTRPTADKVKEAVFSILASQRGELAGLRVLDFFAGGGGLGLEALSRGAAWAVFCDQSLEAISAIKRNLAAMNETKAAVIKTRWPQGFSRLAGQAPFDLFFLDPPYRRAALPLELLKASSSRRLAAPGALAVWEQDPGTLLSWDKNAAAPWLLAKTQVWGNQAAAFFVHA